MEWLYGILIYLLGSVFAYRTARNDRLLRDDKSAAYIAAFFSWGFLFLTFIGEMGGD